jgi:hypothetical protein
MEPLTPFKSHFAKYLELRSIKFDESKPFYENSEAIQQTMLWAFKSAWLNKKEQALPTRIREAQSSKAEIILPTIRKSHNQLFGLLSKSFTEWEERDWSYACGHVAQMFNATQASKPSSSNDSEEGNYLLSLIFKTNLDNNNTPTLRELKTTVRGLVNEVADVKEAVASVQRDIGEILQLLKRKQPDQVRKEQEEEEDSSYLDTSTTAQTPVESEEVSETPASESDSESSSTRSTKRKPGRPRKKDSKRGKRL